MRRVTDTTYYGLRAKWPKARMIRPIGRGFEGYVFTDPAPEPRKSTDSRYTQHNFMDKG